jgi:hypothetical protein
MLQSDGFGPAYRDLARREPVLARLITVYGRRTRSNGTTGDAPGPASSRPCCCTLWDSRYQPSQRSRSTTGLARPPAAFPRRPAFSASARTASGPAGPRYSTGETHRHARDRRCHDQPGGKSASHRHRG